jgi:hypothetical protein
MGLRDIQSVPTVSQHVQEAEDMMSLPSPRDSNSPQGLTGMVKDVIGQMRNNMKKNKARERAMSTVTQVPDDVAWREQEMMGSEEDWDASEDSADGNADPGKPTKRHSADTPGLSTVNKVSQLHVWLLLATVSIPRHQHMKLG